LLNHYVRDVLVKGGAVVICEVPRTATLPLCTTLRRGERLVDGELENK
jgi:hypothetical protein